MGTMIDYSTIKTVHCIGIGGIGVSALARLLMHEGKRVSGSDRNASTITEALMGEGVVISIGHAAENIPVDTDLVVYSPAVRKDNPERQEALRRDIPALTYPQMLGVVSQGKRTIAVSGTHGKTTTTAMIAKILIDAGLSPTVIVGSLLAEGGSNFVAGESDIFVVEACEYCRSFLELSPHILVITNIDEDHLDYYRDLVDIQSAFRDLTQKVPNDGFVVCDPHDEKVLPVLNSVAGEVVDYSHYDLGEVVVGVPGEHNKRNARAAATAAARFGVADASIRASLAAFRGTWRRFEYKGETKSGAQLYDDYAHHPAEIRATLQGARELFPDKKIIVAFQPHLYSRTKLLLSDFAQSFADADEVVLAPIYAAREEPIAGVSSEHLAEAMSAYHKNVVALPSLAALANHLRTRSLPDTILITMGAGDISAVGEYIVDNPSNY